jgi:hypothetical protein
VRLPHDLRDARLAVLDARDEPGERPAIPGEHPLDEEIRLAVRAHSVTLVPRRN